MEWEERFLPRLTQSVLAQARYVRQFGRWSTTSIGTSQQQTERHQEGMFALRNKDTGKAGQARELQKLKRQDLLELLLEQMRENDDLSLKLERREIAIQGLEGTVERLKDKLDLKDAQIEHLKSRLDDKDAQIGRLKGKLDDKDATIGKLTNRLDIKDRVIANLMSGGGETDIELSVMEDLLKAEGFALEALIARQREAEAKAAATKAETARGTTEEAQPQSGQTAAGATAAEAKAQPLQGNSATVQPDEVAAQRL